MAQPPSTPVKVPSAAANYTPATLDPDLRSHINTALLRDGHISKIQDSLLHSLNAHSTDWPTLIQNHALSLLRSGEVTTFPALLSRVLDDIRADAHDSGSNNNGAAVNGNGKKAANGNAATDKQSLSLPQSVVDEAVKVTRESLEAVCEVEDGAPH